MLVRVTALFAALASLLAIGALFAGCGGGSSGETTAGGAPESSESSEVSKAGFIEEADAVCKSYQAERKPIQAEIEAIEGGSNPESPKNVVRLGELLREAIAGAEGELESIRELQPPQADKATIGKMLDTAQEGNARGIEAAEALEEGETKRFGELAPEVETTNNRAKRLAEAYGLKVCGQAQ